MFGPEAWWLSHSTHDHEWRRPGKSSEISRFSCPQTLSVQQQHGWFSSAKQEQQTAVWRDFRAGQNCKPYCWWTHIGVCPTNCHQFFCLSSTSTHFTKHLLCALHYHDLFLYTCVDILVSSRRSGSQVLWSYLLFHRFHFSSVSVCQSVLPRCWQINTI